MKRTLNAAVAAALYLALAVPAAAAPASSNTPSDPAADRITALHEARAAALTNNQWNAFSRNLVAAIRTPNEGVQAEAMRLAIQYVGRVDIKAARIDLMRVYRDAGDETVRRMAVVAMGTLGDGFTIGYLQRAAAFEASPPVRRTLNDVVASYFETK